MSEFLATLDGPVTWEFAVAALVLIGFFAVVFAIITEIARPDRSGDR